MKKKIGPVFLCGFMIGPILGSGVVLLPPLAFNAISNQAIFAWIIIMVIGGFFAMIFAKLSVIYPGEGGMTIAIEKSFGEKAKLLSSLLMIVAVMFGPTAVLLTASEYLAKLKIFENINPTVITMILVAVGFLLLMNDIKAISKFILITSSVIAIILLVSGIHVLISNGIKIGSVNEIEWRSFGKIVLLLFWAIIGWEIVGNYSASVKNVQRTAIVATIFSVIIISVTYIVIALAIQSCAVKNASLVDVLYPLFGTYSKWILSLLVTGLCFSTYLTIVGALGRLVHSLSLERYLPKVLSKQNNKDIPVVAIGYFTMIHIIVLLLVLFDIFDIEKIVAIANGFFIGNALLGISASYKIINELAYRISGILLMVSLICILAFSSMSIFVGYAVLIYIAILISNKKRMYA